MKFSTLSAVVLLATAINASPIVAPPSQMNGGGKTVNPSTPSPSLPAPTKQSIFMRPMTKVPSRISFVYSVLNVANPKGPVAPDALPRFYCNKQQMIVPYVNLPNDERLIHLDAGFECNNFQVSVPANKRVVINVRGMQFDGLNAPRTTVQNIFRPSADLKINLATGDHSFALTSISSKILCETALQNAVCFPVKQLTKNNVVHISASFAPQMNFSGPVPTWGPGSVLGPMPTWGPGFPDGPIPIGDHGSVLGPMPTWGPGFPDGPIPIGDHGSVLGPMPTWISGFPDGPIPIGDHGSVLGPMPTWISGLPDGPVPIGDHGSVGEPISIGNPGRPDFKKPGPSKMIQETISLYPDAAEGYFFAPMESEKLAGFQIAGISFNVRNGTTMADGNAWRIGGAKIKGNFGDIVHAVNMKSTDQSFKSGTFATGSYYVDLMSQMGKVVPSPTPL